MLKTLLIIFLLNIQALPQESDTMFVAFWNFENLFDTEDDPLIDDAEYLPQSEKQWDSLKLNTKLSNLSAVINLMNDGRGPDILGYCEVENESVINTLINYKLGNYKAAHVESPDNRGIDNGLLYNSSMFSLLSVEANEVTLEDGYPTRQVVKVSLLHESDTLHFFINHWPSRRGGESESAKNRAAAASVLKNSVDMILSADSYADIFIIGDFNDEPGDSSLSEVLQAVPYFCEDVTDQNNSRLYNLAYKKYLFGEGSYKYQKEWNMLDQIIISSPLTTGSLTYICDSFEVFKPELMITMKGKYSGTPRPTFGGKNYLAGYSDHFPVTAKFVRRK